MKPTSYLRVDKTFENDLPWSFFSSKAGNCRNIILLNMNSFLDISK